MVKPAIEAVLRMGCWTRRQQFGIAVPEEVCKKLAANGGMFWNAKLINGQGSEFEITKYGQGTKGDVVSRSVVEWDVTGVHNVKNAMAAIAAAHHVGIDVGTAIEGLGQYKGVKRRMELRGEVEGVKVLR